MKTRREAVVALLGTGVAVTLPVNGLRAAAVPQKSAPVMPAKLARPPTPKARAPFIPVGEYRTKAIDMGYVEEEWFASGTDDAGRPYTTQVYVRRPRDHARFSGTLIVEAQHPEKITPIYMYSSPYIVRSGHAWACVTSLKQALELNVKTTDPAYYASLDIPADSAAAVLPQDLWATPGYYETARIVARNKLLARFNQASNAILAQVGTALRNSGPFEGWTVRQVLLVGHSATGIITTDFVREAHASHRRAGNKAVYDGYFPAGHPAEVFGPRDVPLIQIICDGDMPDLQHPRRPPIEGRQYRRADSDDPQDRYRLYELAGVPHMGTRYPPHSDTRMWQSGARARPIPLAATMNSLPHHELFNMALNHLVQWVAKGTAPPRARRLELDTAGRFFAKDEHGNTRGGVRCAQMDVPRATYHSAPLNDDGTEMLGAVGTEVAFDKAKMQKLYGDPATYVARFNQRLDEQIRQGWFLAEDSEGMRAEAAAQQW